MVATDQRNRGCGVAITIVLIVLVFVGMAGSKLIDHPVQARSNQVMPNYPAAVHPKGWYSNPANFADRTPVPTPELWSGVFYDQYGYQVLITTDTVRNYHRDTGGGEFFEIDGIRFFRSASGNLFRVVQ